MAHESIVVCLLACMQAQKQRICRGEISPAIRNKISCFRKGSSNGLFDDCVLVSCVPVQFPSSCLLSACTNIANN